MKLPKGLRKRKGVALILALLTTVILVTLSLAFMSLSLSEARTSRSYGYEETSVQAASYGLEYALVYMGHGKGVPPVPDTWEMVHPWPNPGGNSALDFGFYNRLVAYNDTRIIMANQQVPAVSGAGQQIGVTVSDCVSDSSLLAFIPSTLSEPDKAQLRLDLRRIRIVDQDRKLRLMPLNSELAFTCDIVVEPVLLSRSQGRHDFRLTSTARVFQLNGGGANSTEPVATRVVEARIKESSFDYAHFIANGRTWNVNGYTPATTPKVGATDLADYVVIPKDYVEQGPMRVDGQDPELAVPHSVMERVVGNAGNLRFLPESDAGGVKFTHALTINQPANV